MKTGSESVEAIMRRRRILLAVILARMEDTRLLNDVRRIDGGRGLRRRGQENMRWDISWTTS